MTTPIEGSRPAGASRFATDPSVAWKSTEGPAHQSLKGLGCNASRLDAVERGVGRRSVVVARFENLDFCRTGSVDEAVFVVDSA